CSPMFRPLDQVYFRVRFRGFHSREALILRYGANMLALVLAMATADPALAQRIRAGLLTCDVSAGIGFIIGSKKEMACVFTPEGPGRRDDYDGTITKYGLDLGLTGGGGVGWGVFTDTPPGPRLPCRRLHRRKRRSQHRRGTWRQRSSWRIEPHRGTTAALGQRTDRA